MDIYSIGPDELTDYDLQEVKGYKWLVYWYENDYYDGRGEAVALREDGMVDVKYLGHCSCYGPMDDWATGCSTMSVEELLREKDNVHDINIMEELDAKVRELLT